MSDLVASKTYQFQMVSPRSIIALTSTDSMQAAALKVRWEQLNTVLARSGQEQPWTWGSGEPGRA